MSNVLQFVPKNKVKNTPSEMDIISKKCIDSVNNEDSPLSIFLKKHSELLKEIKKVCEECRKAYQDLYYTDDEQVTVDFIALPIDNDYGNMNLDYYCEIQMSIIPRFDK